MDNNGNGQNCLYVVRLDWFDDDDDEYNGMFEPEYHDTKVYVFFSSDMALDFAWAVAYTRLGLDLGNPKNVYLLKAEPDKVAHGYTYLEDSFMASWIEANKNIKSYPVPKIFK